MITTSIPCIKKSILTRKLDTPTLQIKVLSLHKNESYIIDSLAAEAFQLIDGKTHIDKISQVLSKKHNLPIDQVSELVKKFVNNLKELDIVN